MTSKINHLCRLSIFIILTIINFSCRFRNVIDLGFVFKQLKGLLQWVPSTSSTWIFEWRWCRNWLVALMRVIDRHVRINVFKGRTRRLAIWAFRNWKCQQYSATISLAKMENDFILCCLFCHYEWKWFVIIWFSIDLLFGWVFRLLRRVFVFYIEEGKEQSLFTFIVYSSMCEVNESWNNRMQKTDYKLEISRTEDNQLKLLHLTSQQRYDWNFKYSRKFIFSQSWKWILGLSLYSSFIASISVRRDLITFSK